jgi:hypothetical protein
MSAHTPGPWQAMNRTDGITVEANSGAVVQGALMTWADARLIAQAPALLAAAKAALALFEDPDHDDYFDHHRVDEVEWLLREAVAAAEGP